MENLETNEQMVMENGYVVPETDRKYAELIKQGTFLLAVKAYKEDHETDLKQAKDYIDELANKMGCQKAETKGGCMSAVMLFIICSGAMAICLL